MSINEDTNDLAFRREIQHKKQAQAMADLQNIVEAQSNVESQVKNLQSNVSLPISEILCDVLEDLHHLQAKLALSQRAVLMEDLFWDDTKPKFPKVVEKS